ncbi:putative endoplasmic reticulum protein [Papiliotrema laurentii]|uniref:Endoplasmic reticulum protein n=1 Tax=Papiliotrema laurentii TaxID=5418 RepID=A0AAD9FXD7_PAPLA|nr:putative endoplasmic reticulum protein [Papiliotrema laurentii]
MPGPDLHYLWALGHGIMLAGAAYTILQTALFRGAPPKIYRLSYTGALLSYAIVVVKSLGVPQASKTWARRAFADENVQYMLLALFWWISKPIGLTIIPFATFSLFHCLTFLRTNIIPKFVPPAPPAVAGQPRPPPAALQNVSNKIQLWVKGNYDSAMRFVAYTELAILARTAVGAVFFTNSFITPLFLLHFIRLRYHASPFSRQAVAQVVSRLDGFILPRGGAIANTYLTAKRIVANWGGGRLMTQQPPAGQPAAAGAGAGAGARR